MYFRLAYYSCPDLVLATTTRRMILTAFACVFRDQERVLVFRVLIVGIVYELKETLNDERVCYVSCDALESRQVDL